MSNFRNLICDDELVQETVELLRACGGSAPTIDVADAILQIANLDETLAIKLVEELIRDDCRLSLNNGKTVELKDNNHDARILAQSDYVVVDLETTGAKAPPCRITEIGAYKISRGRIVAEYETLINPQTNIPPFIVALTGITNDMVKDAPLFSDTLNDWLDFVDDAVIVAHNTAFDIRFLNHEIGLIYPGLRMANPHLCTVKLSRRLLPDLENHKLHTVAEYFSIPISNRHRAAGDALATAEMFLKMLDQLQEKGIRSLADLRKFKKASVKTKSSKLKLS
jgi:DNA polymerase III epsilon subunit family exonuclease